MTTPHRIPPPLIRYIADYINEELERSKEITGDTIADAVDAFAGGARDTQISGSWTRHGTDRNQTRPLYLSDDGQKVMPDSDLAHLYGVATSSLNEQVKGD